MPRQKQIAAEIKRNVNDTVVEEPLEPNNINSLDEECEQESKEDCDDSDIDEEVPSSSDEFDHVQTDELIVSAQETEKSGNLDQAVKLYEAILSRKCKNTGEVSPELGEHWLNYGNALLSREEMNGELLSCSTDKENDCLEIAWNSLDLARVCLEKLLSEFVPEKLNIIDIDEFSRQYLDHENHQTFAQKLSPDVQRIASLLRFARLRMGDFKQSSHDYEGAVDEFSASLQIALTYCEDTSKALAAAIPIMQCYMALDYENIEVIFKFCELLIEKELAQENLSAERRSLLVETQSDLKLQLQDFLQNRTELVNEMRKLLNPITGATDEQQQPLEDSETVSEQNDKKRPEPDNDEAVVDLGRLGKKNRSEESNDKQ